MTTKILSVLLRGPSVEVDVAGVFSWTTLILGRRKGCLGLSPGFKKVLLVRITTTGFRVVVERLNLGRSRTGLTKPLVVVGASVGGSVGSCSSSSGISVVVVTVVVDVVVVVGASVVEAVVVEGISVVVKNSNSFTSSIVDVSVVGALVVVVVGFVRGAWKRTRLGLSALTRLVSDTDSLDSLDSFSSSIGSSGFVVRMILGLLSKE